MPSTLVKALTELISLHDALERRMKSVEPQTTSTQFAAENKIDDDFFVKTASVPEIERSFVRRFHIFTEFEPRLSDGHRRGAHDLITRATRTHHCPFYVQHSKTSASTSGCNAAARSRVAASAIKTEVSRNVHRLLHTPAVVVNHETGEPNVEMRNCSAREVIRALTLRWLPYFERPRLTRTDPEGCFISRLWWNWLSEQRILGSSQPGEAHWRTSTVERTIQTLKDGATRLSQQMQESIPVDEKSNQSLIGVLLLKCLIKSYGFRLYLLLVLYCPSPRRIRNNFRVLTQSWNHQGQLTLIPLLLPRVKT